MNRSGTATGAPVRSDHIGVRTSGLAETSRRRHLWLWLLAVNAGLALPTAVSSSSLFADITYLMGLILVLGVLIAATLRVNAAERRVWLLFSAVAVMWLAGDVVERVLVAVGRSPAIGDVGPADVFWLASYPLEVMAVAALIGARRLPRQIVRDIRLDVLTITVAPALGAWIVLVEPRLDAAGSVVGVLGQLLYPLGDVMVFGLALTTLLIPGSRGLATVALVVCMGASLPLDLLLQLLDNVAPTFDSGRLDAVFLFCNTLLGVAVLHPSRSRLPAPARDDAGRHLHVWRTSVLGLSLLVVSLTNVFAPTTGWHRVPGLLATVVIAVSIVIRFHRITHAQEISARALRRMAEHDQLTGAANREVLTRRLPGFLATAPGAIVYIDLDGFKALNDRHGHSTGDAMLCAVTERLGRLVGDDDLIARTGGDEFVLLLFSCDEDRARDVTSRLLEALCAPLELGSVTVQVGASIGVLVLRRPEDPVSVEDVLHTADAAMYESKRRGGGINVVRYREEGSSAGGNEPTHEPRRRSSVPVRPTSEKETAVVA